MARNPRIHRTEVVLAAACAIGIAIAAMLEAPWSIFAAAIGLAALFAAVMHYLTRRARLANPATAAPAASVHQPRADPRARKRRRRR